MYSQPLVDAIAEAERLVVEAPHIESEADRLEGLQYLAGCVAACMHLAFDYERDHPFLQSGTGPFTKMGLDNPDTLYFGTRVHAERRAGARFARAARIGTGGACGRASSQGLRPGSRSPHEQTGA